MTALLLSALRSTVDTSVCWITGNAEGGHCSSCATAVAPHDNIVPRSKSFFMTAPFVQEPGGSGSARAQLLGNLARAMSCWALPVYGSLSDLVNRPLSGRPPSA